MSLFESLYFDGDSSPKSPESAQLKAQQQAGDALRTESSYLSPPSGRPLRPTLVAAGAPRAVAGGNTDKSAVATTPVKPAISATVATVSPLVRDAARTSSTDTRSLTVPSLSFNVGYTEVPGYGVAGDPATEYGAIKSAAKDPLRMLQQFGKDSVAYVSKNYVQLLKSAAEAGGIAAIAGAVGLSGPELLTAGLLYGAYQLSKNPQAAAKWLDKEASAIKTIATTSKSMAKNNPELAKKLSAAKAEFHGLVGKGLEFAAAAAGGRLGYEAGTTIGLAVRTAMAKAGTEQPVLTTASSAKLGSRPQEVPTDTAVKMKGQRDGQKDSIKRNDNDREANQARIIESERQLVFGGKVKIYEAKDSDWRKYLKTLPKDVQKQVMDTLEKLSKDGFLPSKIHKVGNVHEFVFSDGKVSRLYFESGLHPGPIGHTSEGEITILGMGTKGTQEGGINKAGSILQRLLPKHPKK